jgi:hypothetical protein
VIAYALSVVVDERLEDSEAAQSASAKVREEMRRRS